MKKHIHRIEVLEGELVTLNDRIVYNFRLKMACQIKYDDGALEISVYDLG